MSTPADYGMTTPTGNDLIRDGDDAITNNATKTAQLLGETLAVTRTHPIYRRGNIAAGTDLDQFKASSASGWYEVTGGTAAAGLVNAPAPDGRDLSPGVLEVFRASNGITVQRYTEYGTHQSIWYRTTQSVSLGTFRPWVKLPEPDDVYSRKETDERYGSALTTATDLNTVTTSGWRSVPTGSIASSLVNAPRGSSTAPGALEVFYLPNGVLVQRYTEYAGALRVWVRATQNLTSGTFTPWRPLAFTDEVPDMSGTAAPTAAHTVRAQTAAARRGGIIGTAGKPVVALRFDHGSAGLRDHVLPILRSRAMPASVCHNSRTWHRAEYDGLTATDVQPWLLENGIELWNHGATHNDATGQAAIHDEIVNGLTELAAQFPKVAIDGWMPPGPAAIDPDVGVYDGYGSGATDASYDTYAGQLILAHHGMATGYRPGTVLPLAGRPIIGARHYTWDAATVSQVQARIEEAIALGGGLVLMLHPSLIGTTGYVTAAQVATVLGWLADQRDAGRLDVLTVGGLLHADTERATRHNLLAPMTSPSLVPSQTPLTRSTLATVWSQALGSVRRIELDIETTTAGTVDVAVEGAGTQTLTLPTGRSTLARHITIPLDATRCHVTVTPSVTATIHQLAALAT